MAIGNLKGATAVLATNWTATSRYGIFTVNGTLNGVAFTKLYIGYSSTTSGATNRIYYLKSSGSYASISNTTAITFVFDASADIEITNLISWLESNNAIITGGYKAGKGIQIGNEHINLVYHGDELIKDIYNDNTLIYRAFQQVVEGYNVSALDPVSNGSSFTFPTNQWGVPSGWKFDGYSFEGAEYQPGDVYTYSDNPYNAIIGSGYNTLTPYIYKSRIAVSYIEDTGGDSGGGDTTTVNKIINLSGFDVNANGDRQDWSYNTTKTGVQGESFGFNLVEIYYQSGFTSTVSGLTIAGITDLSGASIMTRWQRGISASSGQATAPSPLYSQSQNLSGTYNNTTDNYYYVYKYNGYYFV